MPITIKELSKHCGLSVSTVSKALNGYSDISEATRAQVIAAAQELGYHPNAHARALKSGRSYNLGVLFMDESTSGLGHPFFSSVLQSFKSEAEKHGYDITFISHNMGDGRFTYLEHCYYREVDGVCVACIHFDEPEVRELVASELPVVTIDHVFNSRVCIQSDNAAGMRMLVDYICDQGHRDIAFVHGPRSSVTNMRLGSFHRAMQQHGLPIREEWLPESDYINPGKLYTWVKRLLAMKERPTCIICPDDFSAIGAYQVAAELGLRIPDDISVAGFDGIHTMQLMKPRLTTVRQDAARIGQEAASQLIGLVESPRTAIPGVSVVPCELLPGGSVARIG